MTEVNQVGPGTPPRLEREALKGQIVEFGDAFEIADPEAGYDLRMFGRALHRRQSTILSVFFVILVVGTIATLKQKPIYRAQGTLEIQRENPDIPTIQELYQLENVSDDYLKTQYNILASNSLARRVIEQLHLDGITEFREPNWWSWKRYIGNPSTAAFAIGSAPAGRNRELEQRVLERFQSRLTIDPVTRSRLVDVKFESRDPGLSARVVNTLAADFIEDSLNARWVAAQTAADWLSQQLDGVKGRLEKSEDELQVYAHKNGLTILQNDKGVVQNVANDRLQELQQELTRAQAERYSKQATYGLLQKSNPGALPGVFESKILQDLTVRLAELKQQHAQLSSTFSPDYPRVKEVQTQIDEIETSLQQERTRAAEQITNEYLAAAQREQLLRQALSEQQSQIDVIAEKSVQYNILKREVDTNKQLYDGLLQQWKAAGLSVSLKAANIRVVDPAEAPVKPMRPIIVLNLAVTIFLGVVLGMCAVLAQEWLDDTIKGADDVERLFGFSALALIPGVPALNASQPRFVRFLKAGEARTNGNGSGRKSVAKWYRIDRDGADHPSMMEAFRGLRTSVLLSAADAPPNSVLVTSTQPAEGKTTIATNLALTLAQAGQRVLLVDSDLRSPSLHRLFGRLHDPGLVCYLTGREDWHRLICPSGTAGVDLVTCGPVPPNPSELLSSPRMMQFIKSAKERYDLIILDSAPMLALADSRILAPMVSGVLLVVKSGTVPREQVLHAQKDILSVGANLLGVVLNRVDLATRGYYDYSSYESPMEGAWKQESLEANIHGTLTEFQRVR